MVAIELGQDARLELLLADGATDLFPRATIYNGGVVPVAAVNLDHVGLGFYRAYWTPSSAGSYTAVFRVFTDVARTTLADYDHSSDSIVVSLPPDEPMLGVNYDSDSDTLRLDSWVLRRGQQVLNVTSVTIDVYVGDDTLLFTVSDSSPDAGGVFRINKIAPGILAGQQYNCRISVVTPLGTVVGRKGFKVVI